MIIAVTSGGAGIPLGRDPASPGALVHQGSAEHAHPFGSGAALGFGLGLILALFSMSKRSVVRAPPGSTSTSSAERPLIWQMAFAGIGFVPALRLNLDMYTIAILVLGLNLAAYSAEVYRSGIQSLERGQIEAARTVGLTYFQAMQYVVVPQAIRRVIPPLLNEFVILIKGHCTGLGARSHRRREGTPRHRPRHLRVDL